MKGFILCFILLVPAVLAKVREDCEAGNLTPGYYPHSQYCNMFYSCVFDTLYEHRCVHPFLWNNDRQNCDYPENVDCGNLIVPQKRSDNVVDEPEDIVEEIPEEILENDLVPQPAQGCPCSQGCQGANEDPTAAGCGCGGCGGGAASTCPGNCAGGCGCGSCGAAQGGCPQAPQAPCTGNNPTSCGCAGCGCSACGCGGSCGANDIPNDIPRPPVPVDIVAKMFQASQPPRPGCGCQSGNINPRQGCGCQSGNNGPRPELTPF